MADLRDRVTVVETVYHRQVEKQRDPFSTDSRFTRYLETQQQVYQRQLEATEDWQPLDCGWLPDAGMLLIQNDEGLFLPKNLTKEEQKELSQKVIELSFGAGCSGSWWVLPGESMRGYPTTTDGLEIRCQKGTAEFTLTLFPR